MKVALQRADDEALQINGFRHGDQRRSITDVRFRLAEKFPGVFEAPEFNAEFGRLHGSTRRRTVPTTGENQPGLVAQLRPSGMGIREYEFDGVRMHLKVAKYETEGVKEIWELFMKPGFYCEWDDFLFEYRVFYVTQCRLRCLVKTAVDEKRNTA